MWRLLLALGVLAGIGAQSAPAQQWSGTAALNLSGGHQTNLYLDPVLGTWNPNAKSPFFALTPEVGLHRDAQRTRIDVTVRARMHTRRTDIPQLSQSMFSVGRRLTPDWTLSLVGGGTRYRYPAPENGRTARNSWWGLPSLRWTPTSETMITLRAGFTQRFEQLSSGTDRQTSGLASLRASYWLSDRLQAGGHVYFSSGRTSTAETDFGGAGGTVDLTYWPSNTVSVQMDVGIEQLQYETRQPSGTLRENLHRAGAEVNWRPRSSITLFGRAKALYASLATTDDRTDVHASAGLRIQMQGVLGGTTESPLQQRVCHETDDGIRLQLPFDGSGTPHVTGDFNNWSLPGVPLERADDGLWTTTLELPPGRYAYRLRVVDGDDARWIDLPSYAQTANDPFGGTNGVCTIH